MVPSTRCADASLTPASGTPASETLADFQFALPAELIAQLPVARRDAARLMVLDRARASMAHSHVSALPDYLQSGDLLVANDTKVIPARLFGRVPTGGAVEVLLIRPTDDRTHGGTTWFCLGKPARRLRLGSRLTFSEAHATVVAAHGDGRYSLAFEDAEDILQVMNRHGEIPLPPYIHRPDGPLPIDQTRYQTIFASTPGAIAAPTAGLHFTDELVAGLRRRGVEIARLTLHVGPGTFLPVRVADVQRHVMEPEWCEIPEATVTAIRRVRAAGGRVVAVGTTTTRALESAACDRSLVTSGGRWADRFITPGYRFRVVDALFTNFHLPGSTLLLLVSAFASRERILAAYAEAVRQRYRFYSYGDAMLIL
jgi:S-adenosylmethionine:tRNA ribosyltransferase-isomerase